MSRDRVSLLTPPGTGAIATLAIAGPKVWAIARQLFRRAGGKPLPETPEIDGFWYGTLGEGAGDEVVLAVKQVVPEPQMEVHCHGGRQVVRWLIGQLISCGCDEVPALAFSASPSPPQAEACGYRDRRALPALIAAPTTRTATILLDQLHGAFQRAVSSVLARLEAGDLEAATAELAALAAQSPTGRHLVEPWIVAIAGPPNVGKSSLINALAGYQRSIVSEQPGTTRDVVTVPVAFAGWPVELADTAGLRRAVESLEAQGIERARSVLKNADLILWVMDASAAQPTWPDPSDESIQSRKIILILNKIDQPACWDLSLASGAIRISALSGFGISDLAAAIADTLVPNPPSPGQAVPFTPQLVGRIEFAYQALREGRIVAAIVQLNEAQES